MNSNYFIKLPEYKIKEGQMPIIFFHGFTGSADDWDFIFQEIPANFYPAAFDLPGHGKNLFPADEKYYTSSFIIEQVKNVYGFLNINKAILAGYSMGGRAALTFAVNNPLLVAGLFLESTTAGIQDTTERAERMKADYQLADFIMQNKLEEFVNYWMNIPLFESQKKLSKEALNKVRNAKLDNSKAGLAYSLKGFGTGSMCPLWEDLKLLDIPVHLITGMLDNKFTQLNDQMNSHLPLCVHTLVENCGHNIHLENPEEFLSVLLLFLKRF